MVCGGIARFDTGCGVKSLGVVVLPFLRWWVEKLGESQPAEARAGGWDRHESWAGKLAAALFFSIHRQQKGTISGVNDTNSSGKDYIHYYYGCITNTNTNNKQQV